MKVGRVSRLVWNTTGHTWSQSRKFRGRPKLPGMSMKVVGFLAAKPLRRTDRVLAAVLCNHGLGRVVSV